MESMMAKHKRQINGLGIDNQGFTLIEVLVAMVVATIGLMGIAMMQSYAIEGNGTASRYSQATSLAQARLEQIKDGNLVADGTFGYIDMDSYTGVNPIETGPPETGIDENGKAGGPFNLTWSVSTSSDWARRIQVRVTWLDSHSVSRKVTLESLSRGDGN
jgi:prepilin-type N-terminal cleavage/methylation domain-containing protein